MSGRGSEPKSVGKALRKALGHETFKFDVESRKDGRSQLMNPRRLRIFSYLWKMPCSHIRQISRATRIPVESLKWHLRTLEKFELLKSRKSSRRVAYFPVGLVRAKDIELFSQISDPRRREIVRVLSEKSDVTLDDMSSKVSLSKQALHHHLSILEDLSVITSPKGKRPARYSIHENMKGLARVYENRTGEVLKQLVSSLTRDCLNPKVKALRDDVVRIRISLGVRQRSIRFGLNPLGYFSPKK